MWDLKFKWKVALVPDSSLRQRHLKYLKIRSLNKKCSESKHDHGILFRWINLPIQQKKKSESNFGQNGKSY